eukprot:365125-Chlamydomonas_euryale.AAC.5
MEVRWRRTWHGCLVGRQRGSVGSCAHIAMSSFSLCPSLCNHRVIRTAGCTASQDQQTFEETRLKKDDWAEFLKVQRVFSGVQECPGVSKGCPVPPHPLSQPATVVL